METDGKRSAGRPKIGRRRVVIVSDEQWNAWRAAAEREQTSVGEQIRRLMDQWAIGWEQGRNDT